MNLPHLLPLLYILTQPTTHDPLHTLTFQPHPRQLVDSNQYFNRQHLSPDPYSTIQRSGINIIYIPKDCLTILVSGYIHHVYKKKIQYTWIPLIIQYLALESPLYCSPSGLNKKYKRRRRIRKFLHLRGFKLNITTLYTPHHFRQKLLLNEHQTFIDNISSSFFYNNTGNSLSVAEQIKAKQKPAYICCIFHYYPFALSVQRLEKAINQTRIAKVQISKIVHFYPPVKAVVLYNTPIHTSNVLQAPPPHPIPFRLLRSLFLFETITIFDQEGEPHYHTYKQLKQCTLVQYLDYLAQSKAFDMIYTGSSYILPQRKTVVFWEEHKKTLEFIPLNANLVTIPITREEMLPTL